MFSNKQRKIKFLLPLMPQLIPAAKPKREKIMAVRERTIPCSDFAEWKHDLESTGFHVIDSTPIDG